MTTTAWTCAVELDPKRRVTAGSYESLCAAIARGADLRVYTEFIHEEHIAPGGSAEAQKSKGLIREVIDFRETMLVAGRHAAGVTLYRQPLEPTTGFNGATPKTSFFLYNMDGHQACANLLLDAVARTAPPGKRTTSPTPADMPKMSPEEQFDLETHGPSRNFVYDMEVYRYFVRDEWTEVFAHDADGRALRGDFDALERAQLAGREWKLSIRGLCDDLVRGGEPMEHEIFSHCGSSFLHTGRRFHELLTHPIVRVAPSIPVKYASGNWDVVWVSIRTDGVATIRSLNPYTRQFSDRRTRLACRWFVR